MSVSPLLSRRYLVHLANANLPPILWAGIIFWFSSQSSFPSLQLSVLDFVSRKLAHIFIYLVLFMLVYRSIIIQNLAKARTRRAFFMAILVCIIYAISDELHQLNVPGRFGSLRDVAYDGLGVSIALLRKAGYI